MSKNLYEVSEQWAKRPMDERFLSVRELYDSVKARRENSTQIDAALEHLQIKTDSKSLFLESPETGAEVKLNHWSFGQLSSLVKAPAGFLRELPPELAAVNLQYKLENSDRQDMRLLQTENDSGPEMRSINSSTYGRVWDEQVVRLVLENVDLDQWKVPHASYASNNPKLASTLYASDRDCFMFLVNEENPVELPGNGGRDTMFRGFIIGNSEVGSKTLFLKQFLYRTVCDNRIIWGVQDQVDRKIVHSSGAPARFKRELRPALSRFLTEGTSETVKVIDAARGFDVGKNDRDVAAFLNKQSGFTKVLTKAAMQRAEEEEGENRSLWSLIQGVTSVAKDSNHADQRLTLEQTGSKLMKYAEARV
tara:strand:- start:940 stop:2031 length:1092 start_codon:yes stop_codon:yes gene_type:complete